MSCFFLLIVLLTEIFQVKKSLIEHSTKKIVLIQKVTYECFAKLQSYLGGIHHFRSEKRSGAEMPHAYCFRDRCWGSADQLLAIFSRVSRNSPRSLCET